MLQLKEYILIGSILFKSDNVARISKAYFCLIAGVLAGIIVVSMLRNGEINWVVTGTTFSLSILAFLLYCLLVWKSKRKNIE